MDRETKSDLKVMYRVIKYIYDTKNHFIKFKNKEKENSLWKVIFY